MSDDSDVDLVRRFWQTLAARDWEALEGFFGPDSVYLDVPVGPAAAAKGREDIVARIKLGLADLAAYEHFEGPIVAGDGVVMLEHREVWHWPTGETATLPFVTVMHLAGGVITVWKDYWDYQTLMQAAPAGWQERLETADLSWIYDATDDQLTP
jgi:limonene-1,2-epoxide hydrolase